MKTNKDFFDIGNVGWFSIIMRQGNYTGDKECIEKYKKIDTLIGKVKLYYEFMHNIKKN